MKSGIFAPNPRPKAAYRLFCLPYAGGSSNTYLDWQKQLDDRIELVCIDPPGRGTRFNEDPVDKLDRLAPQLASEMQVWLDRPFCILGHSNGALIGFELARLLQRQGLSPEIFFACAKSAPSCIAEDPTHTLSDADFIEELRDGGNTPEEFFDTPELVELFLPLLRADFSLSGSYKYRTAAAISANLVMLSGSDDQGCMDAQDRAAWAREFDGVARWHVIEGDHFFVDQNPKQMIAVLNLAFKELLLDAYA